MIVFGIYYGSLRKRGSWCVCVKLQSLLGNEVVENMLSMFEALGFFSMRERKERKKMKSVLKKRNRRYSSILLSNKKELILGQFARALC